MHKKIIFSLYLGLLMHLCFAQTEQADFSHIQWTVQKLSPGITWKHYVYDSLHHTPQSINVLEINLAETDYEMGFAFLNDARKTTDELAAEANAFAAINGTFFNMAQGGSVCYLKVDDTVRNYSQPDLRSYIHNGAISIDSVGKLHIISRPDNDWTELNYFRDVMSSGPLLIKDGEMCAFEKDKFNENRHPRTGIGINQEGHIIMVTVDGRNKRASGMSIPEFASFMKYLRCNHALNLDGGGSTTMYIQGQHTNGIVNYPSDNKTFDHQGQRTVSNIVLIAPPRKRN